MKAVIPSKPPHPKPHSAPPWALLLLMLVGLCLLSVTPCPHIHWAGRATCGLVGAILVLAFTANVVGVSALREVKAGSIASIYPRIPKLWGVRYEHGHHGPRVGGAC